MSEYLTTPVASITEPPTGDVLIPHGLILKSHREKGIGFVAIGFTDRLQKEVVLDKNGVAFVEMNSSGRLQLPPGEEGIVATDSLTGCTGVAGFAKKKDGRSLAFISHYDPLAQNSALTAEDSPVNRELYQFKHQAAEGLDGLIYYLIVYPSIEHDNPQYGKQWGEFKNWRYLDQINITARQLGENARVLLMPYEMASGETLASGRAAGQEGIFWNGIKIDFEKYFAERNKD